jgi:hypothetical protein
MATVTQQPTTRGEQLRQELITLAFITRAGNWLFLFMSRLGEPLMFLSTLYVIAETVLPGIFKAPVFVQVSSVSVIVLNIAPEVILPGCFMQAGTASEQQRWMYKAMGCAFVALTFVTLASFIWDFPAGVVSVILFFRCAAGVLYSLLVRMTPQGHQDGPTNQQHQAQLDELANTFNQHLQQMENSFNHRLAESVLKLQQDFQSSTAELSTLPMLKEQLAHVESDSHLHFQRVATEIESVKAHLNKQVSVPAIETQKKGERPILRALPSLQQAARPSTTAQGTSEEKFDIRSFVFACLEENAAATIENIQQRALSIGQSVSIGSISKYRKQYSENSAVTFTSSGEGENESENETESESA